MVIAGLSLRMKYNYIISFLALFCFGCGIGFFRVFSGNPLAVHTADDSALPAGGAESVRLRRSVRGLSPEHIEWEKFVEYISRNNMTSTCTDLFKGVRYSDHFLTKWQLFNDKVAEEKKKHGDDEGNVGKYKGQQRFYFRLANLGFVNNICEIGFNFGHSAIFWLESTQKTMLHSFDLLVHKYVRNMVDYLKREYQDRFHIVYGDSRVTVPALRRQKPYLLCDVAVIDGGHDYAIAKADLENMWRMSNRERNIVIYDDCPSRDSDFMKVLGRAWREMQQEGKLKHLFSCMAENGVHGFSVGYFIHK